MRWQERVLEGIEMNCVIDVGGCLRGIYGAGVFDTCYGVSAGSANAVSYLAGQKERNYKFYMEYSFRKEYMSWSNFFKNGSYIDLEYIYGALSNSWGEYPLDFEAASRSGNKLYVVTANAETGHPVYFTLDDMKQDDYGAIKASCCVPFIDKPYMIDGVPYFDGGICDPIPIRRALKEGHEKIVLILTKPADEYRKPDNDIRIARFMLSKYPNAAKALARRAGYYNRSLEIAKQYAAEGRVLIVAPSDIGKMKTLTKDPDSLRMMYDEGRQDGRKIAQFLS